MKVFAKRIEVIEVRSSRGSGKDETDPVRQIVQYFNFEGVLLAETDPAPWFEVHPSDIESMRSGTRGK